MNQVFSVLSSLVLLLTMVTLVQAQDGLNAGDPAPDFSLQGSDGETYSLSQFRGKKGVIIAWFPKAFTGG